VDGNGMADGCERSALPTLPACCIGDLNTDRTVDETDLGTLLASWGACQACAADINDDGVADGADLGVLLNGWGPGQPITPTWAPLVEAALDPAIVSDPQLRAAIQATGLAWRVCHTAPQIEMLLMPPGTFQIGCSASVLHACLDNELPTRPVTLANAFYLGRYEVTQQQWIARMSSNPSMFQGLSNLERSPGRACQRSDGPALHVGHGPAPPHGGRMGVRVPSEHVDCVQQWLE